MRILSAIAGAAMAAFIASSPASADSQLAERIMQLTRGSTWRPVATVPLNFPTHHPQGMVRVGERFFVTSVEIIEATQRYPQLRDGLDRSAGRGRGHLFEIDLQGNLKRQIVLGEGDVYHPGGIDYDGRSIWVPVAEYRPNSRAIVYRVDPTSLEAVEVLRAADHIGGVVRDTETNTLHGVSWGSRRFYRWTLDASGRATNASEPPERLRTLNPSHYIDYQDCHFLGDHRMLCGGLTEYRRTPDAPMFALGGVDIVDLTSGRAVFQVPTLLWTERGNAMNRNPFWAEVRDVAGAAGLRFYFIPEDDADSRLYVYDVTP
jgi:hypothetical protein